MYMKKIEEEKNYNVFILSAKQPMDSWVIFDNKMKNSIFCMVQKNEVMFFYYYYFH